jgi:hypothetical protein
MMKILATILLSLSVILCRAQIVADRTNQIQLDFNKAQVTTKLPKIDWELPRLEYTNSQENKVEIKASVTSPVPLKNIRLAILKSLDEEPTASINITPEVATSATINRSIHLTNGQNYLQDIAENVDGGMVKSSRSVIIGLDALKDAVSINRKDYAIFLATDQYDNSNDLVNPIFDSRTLAKELQERYGFEVKIVENANQDMVFNTLRECATINYKPQDQLFIFFAGHGQYDETFGEGFVVATDSKKNDPGKNSYISHNRLRSNIDNIKCEHVMLLMDVCFGGTFDPILASSRNLYDEIDNKEFTVKKLSTRTRKFFTSGSKEYVSDGTPGSHSPFTVRLLEALKTSGGEDRLLTFSEINIFMQKLQTTPRFGSFGTDQAGSEFLFISK